MNRYTMLNGREFWAPAGGGYVREIDAEHPGTLGRQVCEGLHHMGNTLSWDPRSGPLSRLIQKENAKARAKARRDELARERW